MTSRPRSARRSRPSPAGVSTEPAPGGGGLAAPQLRPPRAGPRRYVDLHVQFARGTSLEEAHHTAHILQDAIQKRLNGADVLIHLEPADRGGPGEELGPRESGGSGLRTG